MSKRVKKNNAFLERPDVAYDDVGCMDLLEGMGVGGMWPFFGWSVRPGWVPILREMLDDLVDAGWDRTGLHQVKQKMGTLRVWIEGLTDGQQDIVDDHEARGQNTCEVCGGTGFIRSLPSGPGRYLIALCDGHAAEAEGRAP